MAQAQQRHDSVAALFGESARDPIMGESAEDYRCALLQRLAPRTRSFKNSIFARLDKATLDVIERKAHDEARMHHRHDAEATPGKLVAYQEQDVSGRLITKFAGDPLGWMQHFMTGAQVGSFVRPKGQ